MSGPAPAEFARSAGAPRDMGILRDAAVLVAPDAAGHGVIEWIGPSSAGQQALAEKYAGDNEPVTTISLRDHIVLPGLINTHHHLYQTLTRAIALDSGLFDWLKTLYPIWLGLTSEAVYVSALTGLAELILSGCATTSDHLYIYPNDCRIDDEIRAAREIGVRFHATRGAMSLGESQGGLPPDKATEREPDILRDSARAIETWHDPARHAMLRVALAPCSPFSVTTGLMRECAALARSHGVMLHTHLAETQDEDAYCLAQFGMRPLDYAASVDWLGHDVWYAHGVHFNAGDIKRMAQHGCGVAHCPASNMRLASGIAPVRLMLGAGMKVGLGVDGSASNDGGHLLAEARQAMLVSRLRPADGNAAGQSALGAYEALWLATRGGAAVLGRDDIGRVEPGCSADLIAIDLNRLEFAGALHDPLAAVVFCAARGVDFSMIDGRVVVEQGQLTTIDLPRVVERHNQISRALIRREPIA
jgi:cytosine/adenosine deaminase-related metal-dependent hydrolase